MKKNKLIWIIAIIGFVITLLLTEVSPYGSHNVADHNDGYGTFDMNKYDPNVVNDVLSSTDDINVYYQYYACDFMFIVFFGMLQITISNALYRKQRRGLYLIAVGIPVLRGILDAVENILLIYIIHTYPAQSESMVNVSSAITSVKFLCMGLWFGLVFIGLILRRLNRSK